MRRYWIVITSVLLFSSYANAQCPGGSCSPPAQQRRQPGTVADASVHIRNGNCEGSGTAVDYDAEQGIALILTCAHLFEAGAGTLTVQWPDGPWMPASLLKTDAVNDVALVTVRVYHRPAMTAVGITPLAPRQRLFKVGYPRGVGPHAGAGSCESNGGTIVFATLFVDHGDSGGGVFSSTGNVVGVVSGYDTRQRGRAVIAGLDPIRAIILSCWRCRPAAPRPPPQAPTRPVQPPSVSEGSGPLGTPGRDGADGKPGPAGPQGPAGPPGTAADNAELVLIRAEIAAIKATLGKLNGSIIIDVQPKK
jgi:S1-C subfamily serine protease